MHFIVLFALILDPIKFAYAEPSIILEEIVVTESLLEPTLSATPIAKEIITKQRINSGTAKNLSDLLSEQSSITSTKTPLGTGLYLRGMGGKHLLILVDGEEVIGEKNGIVDASLIPLDQIEKIEILKGPASARYGSGATAGAVNIITKPPSKRFHVSAEALYGSYNRLEASAKTSSSIGKYLSAEVSYQRRSRDAIDLNSSDNILDMGSFANHHGTIKVSAPLLQNIDITLNNDILVDQSRQLYQMIDDRVADTLRNQHNLSFKWDLDEVTSIKQTSYLTNYINEFREENSSQGKIYRQDKNSEFLLNESLEWTHTSQSGNIETDLATEYSYNQIKTPRISDGENSAHRVGAHGGFSWQISKQFNAEIRSRYDHNFQDFGSFFSPQVGFLYELSPAISVRSHYGYGFKYPSFKERFFEWNHLIYNYRVFGDPNLKAERSRGGEATLELNILEHCLNKFTLFRTDYENFIDTIATGKENGITTYKYRNINNSYTQGIEIETEGLIANILTLGAAYTFLDAKNRATGKPLHNQPKHLLQLNSKLDIKPWDLHISTNGSYIGKQGYFDDNGNGTIDQNEWAPAHWLLDLKLEKSIIRGTTLTAGIENLLNTVHENVNILPGRTFFIGLKSVL